MINVTTLIAALCTFPTVNIKDNATKDFSTKLQNLVDGGPEKLQVIIDFDQTLTKVYDDRTRSESSWMILSKSQLMPEVQSGTQLFKLLLLF